MRTGLVLCSLVAGLVSCSPDVSPVCSEVRFSPLEVDTRGGVVFSWEGDNAQGFAVIDSAGVPVWELLCACPPDGDLPESCRTEEDWAIKACLDSPIVYGVVPEVEGLNEDLSQQIEALPLVTGETYTALIFSQCDVTYGGVARETQDFEAPTATPAE